MRLTHFDELSPGLIESPLPWRQHQTCSTVPRVLALAGLAAMALLWLVPLAIIAGHVAAAPSALAPLADNPRAAVQIVLGLALSCALLGLPIYRMAQQIGRTREVSIEAGTVFVADRGVGRTSTWTEPLSSYLGIAHHIRTTQAGARHELILVHPDARRHVIVAVADRISKAEIERAAATLGIAEVTADLLYRLPRLTALPAFSAAARLRNGQSLQALAAVEV